MTEKLLRYGLVGCGMMGQEHIKNILLLENTQISAIFEPDHGMATIARGLAPNAIFVDSLEALLERRDLDCLVIVSPNYQHIDQMRLIAKTNPLPVLIEKPLATTLKDKTFVDYLKWQYRAPVWVAMEYRYMPPIARLLEQVHDVTGGVKLLTIREHRYPFLEKIGDWNRFNAYSGGTLVEKCCHFFDLMRLIMQCEPTRIQASAGQSVNHLDEKYNGKTSDIWDNGYVIIDFENGARAMLELCMFAEGARYQEEISAVGVKGKIECFVPGPGRFWPQNAGRAPVPQLVISPRDRSKFEVQSVPVDTKLLSIGDHNGATYYQHQKFADVVRGKGKVEVTIQDGWAAVEMGLRAQEVASHC